MAAAPDALAVSADDVHHALKKWGVKFHDDNCNQRSGIYRKLADVVFTEVQTKEDSLWAQLAHLAEILELPPHLAKQADKAAKQLLILSAAVICLQAPKSWISNN